jgi:hypothetical protein
MLKIEEKYNYSRNFKISLIISLIINVLLFYFFPFTNTNHESEKIYREHGLNIALTPASIQGGSAYFKPGEPKIFVSSDVEEPAILEDVSVKEPSANSGNEGNRTGNGNGTGTGSGDGNGSGNNGGNSLAGLNELPYAPRQILEVLPQNINNGAKGYVDIALKIGTEGNVLDYKVIRNTTGSKEILQSVLTAAYKSKWEPVKIKNSKVIYWVEKTYSFN